MGINREQTRILFLGDEEKAKTLIPAGMLVLNIVREQIRLSGGIGAPLKQFSVSRKFSSGVIITAVSTFGQEQINIFAPATGGVVEKPETKIEYQDFYGFICNPRNPGENAGWVGGEAVPPRPGDVYPMPSPAGSNMAILKRAGVYVQKKGPQLYGNIDWVGINTRVDGSHNETVFTWKGPPGRTLLFDYKTPIEGLTTPDISFDGGPYYTCFGPDIYSDGVVWSTLPIVGDVEPKVLGCAIQGNYMVAAINNHYADHTGFFTEIWFASRRGKGLYNEIDNPGGWQKIHSTSAGRATACWFFNQSGTRATQGVYEYHIDCERKIVSLHYDAQGTGTMTVSANIDFSTRETIHVGDWLVWSDYKGDDRVTARIQIVGGDRTTGTNTSSSVTTPSPLFTSGVLSATVTVTIVGDQASAVITGTYCPCTGVWSISNGGSISQTGVINKAVGCGLATVTYTCGSLSGTAQVKLNTGTWIRTECLRDTGITEASMYNSYGGGAGDTYKIEEYWGTKGADLGLETTWYCYWTDGPPAGCFVCGWSGAHYKGCRGNLIPVTGYPSGCTGLNDDEHGCYYFPIWNCSCYGCNKKITYTWGCAGDTEVPDC